MSAREEILGRVRAALADQSRSADVVDRQILSPPGARPHDPVTHFVERVAGYRAVVRRTTSAELSVAMQEALPGGLRVVVPPGIAPEILAAMSEPIVDDGLRPDELDALDAVVTECRVGIAETGTIVLDHGPGQGRRVLTLVPDRHVCVVRADQVVADVPEAVELLSSSVAGGRPLTWISGPSATSDIELDRVEGVHGPRELFVLVLAD